MADKARQGIRSFLRIEQAQRNVIHISEVLDLESNAVKNKIWYRGDGEELSQLYKQIPGDGTRFWAAVPTAGREIRKIHTGLPKIITDTLTSIVLSDMGDITVSKDQDIWEQTAEENQFSQLMEKAISESLVVGDGAFKISFDPDISQLPIIEFISGDRISFEYRRSRLREVVFRTLHQYNHKEYQLLEIYGYGYIKYELRHDDKIINLSAIPQTSGLQDIAFDNSFIMAVPLKVFDSPKWEGRGGSIFDSKTDSFDSLDETWSQWMDALRKGRSKEYIPTDMLPRNPKTGEVLKPNAFDNAFIAHDAPMGEGQQKKIELVQPVIPHDSYLSAYVTALDLCLQGLISPSTLGIDVKKLDNAEAQREKEKATLYTRNKIIEALQAVLPLLIDAVLKSYYTWIKQGLQDIKAEVPFGEYANPSFESQVETVGKAKSQGIMSIEACVEELYGRTKDKKWKEAEVLRLKAEQGITDMAEPGVNVEAGSFGVEIEGSEPNAEV